jgi:imidazolonepropionase-like amidohydrolase
MRSSLPSFGALMIAVLSLANALAAQDPDRIRAGGKKGEAGAGRVLVLVGVNVVDVTGGSTQDNVTVVIKADRIVSIAKRGFIALGRDVQLVNASGKFLIPGLWDMHVHLLQSSSATEAREITVPLLVANGITGVRDMGGDLEQLKQLHSEFESGRGLGPRMVFSGPMIDGDPPRYPASIGVRTANEARAAVGRVKRGGADFIKVQSQLSRDAFFAVADESRRLKIPFAGHVPDAVTAAEASRAGQRSVEHLTGIEEACSAAEDDVRKDDATFAARGNHTAGEDNAYGAARRRKLISTYSPQKTQALAAVLDKNQTWLTPTLVFQDRLRHADEDLLSDTHFRYVTANRRSQWEKERTEFLSGRDPDNLQSWKNFLAQQYREVRDLHSAGVKFMAGTDSGGFFLVPGFALHEEMRLLTRAGFTAMEALQAAIASPARFLGRDDLGSAQPGNLADLVLLEADPRRDIANIDKIWGVVLRGKYLSREDLDRMLKHAATAAEQY